MRVVCTLVLSPYQLSCVHFRALHSISLLPRIFFPGSAPPSFHSTQVSIQRQAFSSCHFTLYCLQILIYAHIYVLISVSFQLSKLMLFYLPFQFLFCILSKIHILSWEGILVTLLIFFLIIDVLATTLGLWLLLVRPLHDADK